MSSFLVHQYKPLHHKKMLYIRANMLHDLLVNDLSSKVNVTQIHWNAIYKLSISVGYLRQCELRDKNCCCNKVFKVGVCKVWLFTDSIIANMATGLEWRKQKQVNFSWMSAEGASWLCIYITMKPLKITVCKWKSTIYPFSVSSNCSFHTFVIIYRQFHLCKIV